MPNCNLNKTLQQYLMHLLLCFCWKCRWLDCQDYCWECQKHQAEHLDAIQSLRVLVVALNLQSYSTCHPRPVELELTHVFCLRLSDSGGGSVQRGRNVLCEARRGCIAESHQHPQRTGRLDSGNCSCEYNAEAKLLLKFKLTLGVMDTTLG